MKNDESFDEFEKELSEYYVILCDRYSKMKVYKCKGENLVKFLRDKHGK
jgi:hypothetical protein